MTADRIRQLREQYKMTQTGLAKKLGISRSSVNAWEMGISVPSTQYIVELSQLFKVTTDHLLCNDKDPAVNVSGLTDEDIRLVNEMIAHLRQKNKNK